MDKIASMRAFCQVVKQGTFSAAAEKLAQSKVLTSRQVAFLEEDLGVRLLQRTTRTLSLTDEGRAYFELCQILLDDFDELETSVKEQHQGVQGRLKLAVPSEAFTCLHLSPFLLQFRAQHPEVQLDINLSDRHLDIVEEGFDVAIRIGQLEDSNLIARPLSDMEVILCCSPAYLDANPNTPINTPQDLNEHTLLVDTNFRSGQHWRFTQGAKSLTINPSGSIRANSSRVVCQFLEMGLGIGACPSFMVDKLLNSGKIVRLLPEWTLLKGGIYVVYSHKKLLSVKVSTFVTALIEHFKQSD